MDLETFTMRQETFTFLRSAWSQGRPIIPLFGAGISVAAGLPTTSQIVEYLIRFRYLAQLEGWPDCSDYVAQRGWPSRHQLNADLLVKSCAHHQNPKKLTAALTDASIAASRAALQAEMGRHHPTVARFMEKLAEKAQAPQDLPRCEWAPLLQMITGGRQSLIDLFFDRLIRGRRPSLGHRFVAFLTKFLNWSPIITTNFDDLIEVALREEGVSPVVYELVSGASMPDARLVASHLSVLKIHGGSFGLRAGLDLNDAVDQATADFFDRCLPRDAVLVVVGYGGGDARIVTLIDALTSNRSADRSRPVRWSRGERDVVWVHWQMHRPRLPNALARHARLLETADGSLFLQELYTRLSLSHAVGQHAYRTLVPVQELFPTEAGSAGGPPEEVSARAARLAVRDRASHEEYLNHTPLWFNLYEVDSLSTFFSLLAEQIRIFDRSFPPRVLSPVGILKQELSRLGLSSKAARQAFDELVRPWCVRLASALRRGRYFLCVDAVRAFANLHPAWRNESETNAEFKLNMLDPFVRFLELLYDETKTPAAIPKCNPLESVLPPLPHGLGDSQIAIVLERTERTAGLDLGRHPNISVHWCRRPDEDVPDPETVTVMDRSTELWPCVEAIVNTAASFRRPRSLVGLIRVASLYLERQHRPVWQGLLDRSDQETIDRRIAGRQTVLYRELERAIELLVERGLLLPLDGASYAMDYNARDAAFGQIPCEEQVQLQDDIADYYRIMLYEQSHDLGAWFEYIFHRVASIRLAWTNGVGDEEDRDLKLRWLIAALRRERAYLIGRGQASAVLHTMARIKEFLGTLPKSGGFVDQVEDIETEIWRDITDFTECKERNLSRLSRSLTGHGPRPPESYCLEGLIEKLATPGDDVAHWAQVGIELGTCLSAPHVAKMEDDNDPTLGEAERLLEKVIETLAMASSQRPGDEDLADLQIHAYLARMDAHLRRASAWTGDAATKPWSKPDQELIEECVRAAEERLRYQGDGAGLRRRRGLMRCLRARSLLFANRFGEANEELNRAHAFMSRAGGPDGRTALAIYHLHRAEYCLAHAQVLGEQDRSGKPSAEAPWLLEVADGALQQAELLLAQGRRDVFWWGRLFILRALCELETVGASIRRLAPSNVQAQPVLLTDGDVAALDIDQQFVRALHAVEGGLSNTFLMEQRHALLDDLWDSLETRHRSFCELVLPKGADVERGAYERWRLLNARANLHPYFLARKARWPVAAGEAHVDKQTLPLTDFQDRGLAVVTPDDFSGGVGPLTVDLDVQNTRVCALKVQWVGNGRRALRIERPSFPQRLQLRRIRNHLASNG